MNLKIISAGAGSGKTYSLTQEMARLLMHGNNGSPSQVRASGILATTFTNKAAAELKERVRIKLLEEGLTEEADELGRAMIGTVHAVGVQLLKRFAFEAGVSPAVDIIAEEDQTAIFNQSIATILTEEKTAEMELLSDKLGFKKSPFASKDWRKEMKTITEIARSNNMNRETLEKSSDYSIKSYFELYPEVSKNSSDFFRNRLEHLLEQTISELKEHPDGTKKKDTLIAALSSHKKNLRLRGSIYWFEWQQIAKACEDAPAKCRENVEELKEFALSHNSHPDFHDDLKNYIIIIFKLAVDALDEYENYKKNRGLIDYTDMEVMILRLLENSFVREVLKEELDLLLVDEFQDTNPIQLKIFLQLTKIAKQSIWVGDPKQSIYGFRGAAPELMEAVIESVGKENIKILDKSWRSRQDLVYMANGLFTKAFTKMPAERVALDIPEDLSKNKESAELGTAMKQLVLSCTDDKPDKTWIFNAIAAATADLLENAEIMVKDRTDGTIRNLIAADIAILCRSNENCQAIADALKKQGMKASIASKGLLQTAEVLMLLACLKFILNEQDSLSVAEIMLLMSGLSLEEIIEKRLNFINQQQSERYSLWTANDEIIEKLQQLRRQTQEMSASEILDLLIEQFNVRHYAAGWGNATQRFANIEALRNFALTYENNCNRLNSAATLGGFLLWLDDMGRDKNDRQGSNNDSNAVNVLTYHKSKGLEWPLVICFDLSNNLKERLYDLRVISENKKIDLEDPLAGRLICYWVNPYGDIEKHALAEAIENHPDRALIRQEALDEEVRLLYVGLTRARDYLALPLIPQHRGKNQGIDWLNRVFHHGKDDLPSMDSMSDVCLWPWKSEEIPIETKHYEFFKKIEDRQLSEDQFSYLLPYSGEKPHSSSMPESPLEWFKDKPEAQLGAMQYYRNPLLLPEDSDIDNNGLSRMLQLYLASDRSNYSPELREKTAVYALRQFRQEYLLDAQTLMKFSDQFRQLLNLKFGPHSAEHNKIFMYRKAEQIFKGKLDYFLQGNNENTVLIMDLSMSYSEFKKRQKKKIQEIAAFFHAALEALKDEIAKKRILLIHFPLEGLLCELNIEAD